MNLGLLVALENADKQTNTQTRFMFYKYRYLYLAASGQSVTWYTTNTTSSYTDLLDTCTTWHHCQVTCEGFGATLLEIDTSAEMEFIRGHLAGNYPIHFKYWVGLEKTQDGDFRWRNSGRAVDPTFWGVQEPQFYDVLARLKVNTLMNETTFYLSGVTGNSSSTHAICEKVEGTAVASTNGQ